MRAVYLLFGFLCMFRFPVPNTEITFLPVLGFALMLFSVLRMEKMVGTFKKAKIVLLVAVPLSAMLLALQICQTLSSDNAVVNVLCNVLDMLTELAEILACIFIYLGVKIVGATVELPALEKQSVRNMTLMSVYVVTYLSINLLYVFVPSVFDGFEFVRIWPFIIGYIWRAFNLWLAFTLASKITASRA